MKLIIASLLALSLTTAPVEAHSRGNDNLVLGVIGGVVLGAVISKSQRDRRDDQYIRDLRRQRAIEENNDYWTTPRRECVEVRYTDRYGRVSYRYECQ